VTGGPTRARRAAGVVLAGVLAAAPVWAAGAPKRVASLNLTADEILVDILPPERLVAVTRWADAPGTSNVVGRVPDTAFRFQKADMERLMALQPDLVILSEYTDADFIRLVERSGIRTHRMTGLGSLAGIRAAILALGDAVGEAGGAQRLVARYDRVLVDLERRLEGARRPRVLYWANPHTAGSATAIGALIEGGGGRNVAAELGISGIAPIGAERAFVADPDVVLIGSGWGSAEALKSHPLLSRLGAVQKGRVVELPTERLVTLSHHAAAACWRLASLLHPDRVTRPDP
jgi:iron complex transport system substrate-binding protein